MTLEKIDSLRALQVEKQDPKGEDQISETGGMDCVHTHSPRSRLQSPSPPRSAVPSLSLSVSSFAHVVSFLPPSFPSSNLSFNSRSVASARRLLDRGHRPSFLSLNTATHHLLIDRHSIMGAISLTHHGPSFPLTRAIFCAVRIPLCEPFSTLSWPIAHTKEKRALSPRPE